VNALIERSIGRFRALVPLLSSLLLAVLGLAPMGMPYAPPVASALALMAVFYWSIFRADLMSMAGALLVGVTVDMLSGGPFGVNALILLLTHELGVSQRRVFLGSSFLVNWWAFSMTALGAGIIAWSISSLLYWHFFPPQPILAGIGLSLLIYPAIYWLLNRLERRWLRPAAAAL